MRTVIVWWDLSESAQTIESLRTYLVQESVAAFSSSRCSSRSDWASALAAEQPLPSRAAELIGYPPTQSEVFDVEATVEGRYEVAQLAWRGLAFATAATAEPPVGGRAG